jgi:methylase of polypeptide subunit release factors
MEGPPVKHRTPIKVDDLHRSWLDLFETDGPFLSLPVLKRVWPAGMAALDAQPKAALRAALPAFAKAWDTLDKARDEAALDQYRTERDDWTATVFRDVFGWGTSYVDAEDPIIAEIRVQAPNRTAHAAPSGALTRGERIGALTLVCDPVESLHAAPDGAASDGWNASPIDRMSELLRASGVPIGVVTDGRWWAVVSAQPEQRTASGVTDAHLWIEEPGAINALAQMLSRKHLVGGKETDRLGRLFTDSIADAADITEALGVQVRRAVELLVQSFSESALRAAADGRPDPLPADRDEAYQAAVTVMMRVVFLLFAEERGLLPENELFAAGYGLSSRFDLLDQRSRDEGLGALGGTYITWHRLLATSRALYEGAQFDELRLPAYGGSLFDPERTAFLTAVGENGLAVTVSDRVMLEVLRAVQKPEVKGEALRISFREIDVEQIGYIYEGLLGYSAKDVEEITVGLIGKAGAEPEMPLSVLEGFAAKHSTEAKLAAAIIKWVKDHQKAAEPPTASALAKALTAEVEDVETAIRAVTMDAELQERLRPFIGVIRRDLRGTPLVVMPGGVTVVETPSRANAGAHYTPKDLAEEVVKHALQPLVHQVGPHQTDDERQWVLLHSDQILELKVADIACGSGAFLVAAARFLAGAVVKAWKEQGDDFGTSKEMETRALRKVVAQCLYGADINELAVEMCKLSLWLVSLDADLPFSFVDDKIFCGNSLLGIVDPKQIEMMRLDQETGTLATLFDIDVKETLDKVTALRRNLASEVDNTDPQRSVAAKRRQVERQRELTKKASDIADGVIAAGLKLGGKPGKKLKEAYENLRIAVGVAYPDHDEPNRDMLDDILDAGLTPTVETDYERWQPLHWALAAPDVVVEHGGFDAIVGNPPFLGGKKLSGAMGTEVRDWFVNRLAGGQQGSADLVAYFFLRARELLRSSGTIGLIATNTIAQGDTREIGLDRLVAGGFTITRSIQSRPWPVKTANLEYAAVWGSFGPVSDGVKRVADDAEADWIITMLDPARGPERHPERLQENVAVAFIGCYVLGMGFVLEPAEAAAWIQIDSKHQEVLFPFLNGEDINQRPDSSAPRWVIDFNDMPESEARRYTVPFERVEQLVRPEREKKNRKAYRDYWWQFAEKLPALRRAISGLDEVLAIALVSKTVMPLRVPTGQVFSHALGVFATDSYADQAVLSSSLHQLWAIKYASSMRTDVRYTPSDVYLTFPRPSNTDALEAVGRTLDTERREMMLRRDLGLTKLYNLVNDPEVTADPDVNRLREIHVELDRAVLDAYGWDIDPGHGFHEYRRMTRFTLSREARVEVFDRLLKENHRRAALQGEAPEVEPEEDDE